MPNVENRRVPRPTKYVGSVNGIEPDKISKELFITGEDIPTTKEEGSNTVAEDIQILYDRPIAIKDEEKILDVSEGKIGSTLSLEQDPDHPLTYHLIGKDNIIISTISFPKDLFLKSVTYDSSTKELVFVFETSSGEQTVRVDVSDLVDIYSAGDGLTLTNGVFAIDTTRVATQNDIATLTDEKADKIPVWEEIAYDANNFSVPAGDRVAFDTTKIPALTLLNPTIPGGLLSDTPSTPYTGHLLGIWTNDNLEFHFGLVDIIDNSFVEVSDFWNTTDGWIQSDFITDEVWNGDWNTGRINVDTTLPTEAFSPRTDISVYQHIGYRNLRDIYIELREADKTLQENIDTKQDELTFDAAPTEDSTNPVTSGGVYEADEALQENIDDLSEEVETDYIKKAYALNGGINPDYELLKSITWEIDAATGHLIVHARTRDMSGVNTNDIEYTYAMPLASSDNDGIMPKESFSTVETLVTKVAALTGAILPKGTIQEDTADVTQANLTAFVGGTPEQGRAVKDLDNVTRVYEAEDELRVQWGDGEIAQATNDDGQTVGTLGLVKGKNADGCVFVENDGTLSVVGRDTLKQRVAQLETDIENKLDKKTTNGDYVYIHNGTTQNEKPYTIAPTASTLAERTNTGTLRGATAVQDTDLVNLGQFNDKVVQKQPTITLTNPTQAQIDALAKYLTGNLVINFTELLTDTRYLSGFLTESVNITINLGGLVHTAGSLIIADCNGIIQINNGTMGDIQVRRSSYIQLYAGANANTLFVYGCNIVVIASGASVGSLTANYGSNVNVLGTIGTIVAASGKVVLNPGSVLTNDYTGSEPIIDLRTNYPQETYQRRFRYSTAEVDTGLKRTDGKNIYRRNFTGTITATADEQVVTVLLGANIVDSIVDCGGWVIPNSNTMKKTSFPMVSFNTTFISNLSIRAADSALVLGTKYILARTDAPYNIWVEYTKN